MSFTPYFFILASEPLAPKLPKPTHQNSSLEKFFDENRNATEIDLAGRGLTDDDMTIVVYYALQEMHVSSLFCEQLVRLFSTHILMV